MVTKVSWAGLFLIFVGLLIVIVHALNLSSQHSFETLMPELGLILVGIAVQILGLGVAFIGKK